MLPIYDKEGELVSWIESPNASLSGLGVNGFLYDFYGSYAGYIESGGIFALSGISLGYIESGFFRDNFGEAVGFIKSATRGPITPLPKVMWNEPIVPVSPITSTSHITELDPISGFCWSKKTWNEFISVGINAE